MINNQIEYLFVLCVKLQEGEDGYCEKRQNKHAKKPTAFFSFYGHISEVEISVYKEGWKGTVGEPVKRFSFKLNKEIDKNEFEKCRDYLLELIKEQEEQK